MSKFALFFVGTLAMSILSYARENNIAGKTFQYNMNRQQSCVVNYTIDGGGHFSSLRATVQLTKNGIPGEVKYYSASSWGKEFELMRDSTSLARSIAQDGNCALVETIGKNYFYKSHPFEEGNLTGKPAN